MFYLTLSKHLLLRYLQSIHFSLIFIFQQYFVECSDTSPLKSDQLEFQEGEEDEEGADDDDGEDEG